MQKVSLRGGALLLAAVLLASLAGGCARQGQPAATAAVPAAQAEAESGGGTEPPAGSAMREDKTETVYVQAGADGSAQKTTVETVLRSTGAGGTITDISTLKDIKNTQGEEEFTQDGSTLVWQDQGEDIHYKGEAVGELPVTVRISYYLDGQLIQPEALAGKSGQVRIRFDYQNNVRRTAEVGGKELTVQVPFTVLTAMVLPEDVFRDVEVDGGKAVSVDGQTVAVGLVFPGLAQSLNLAGYEPTKEIELPDHLEVTAAVTDFALDFTATVVTPGLFSELDPDDLNEIDDLIDDMDKLADASRKLVDGTAELLDGAQTFGGYLDTYVAGVQAVDEGAAALAEGLETLNSQKSNLETGAAALQKGLETLNASLSQLALPDLGAGPSAGEGGTGTEPTDEQLVMQAAAALFADAKTLWELLAAQQETLGALAEFARQAAGYSAAVQGHVKAASGKLEAIEWQALEAEAARRAAEQAQTEVNAALGESTLTGEEQQALQEALDGLSELTEEQRAALLALVGSTVEKAVSARAEAAGSALDGGIDLTGITADAQSQVAAAQAELAQIKPLTLPETLALDTEAVAAILTDMQAQLQTLSAYGDTLAGMGRQLAGLADALKALQTGTARLAEGSAQLTAGVAAFNKGVGQLYEGSAQLSGGTAALADAGGELADGFDTLADGMRALNEGAAAFDREGIQSLTDLAGNDLAALADRLRALQAADAGYTNYAGIAPGKTGSVRFLIETAEIKGG